MSVVVAEGVVEVTANAKGVPAQIAKDVDAGGSQANASGMGLGKQLFGGIMAGWVAIGGVSAVVGFFTGAVSGASDLNETMSKSETIFGNQAGAMLDWSKTAATSLGLGQEAALAAGAGFGDMFTQIGFTSDAAARMSREVVQAAADLGSFSNLDTADVADRMSAAFRGEYDSLQAVIPNINAARVESEALAATGKTTATSLTAQEKAAAVLAIVQRDGARAMGDFAKTSDGAANSAKIVTAQFADQQSKLGQQLLPIWTGFLHFLSGTVIPVFSEVVEWTSQNTDTLMMLGATIGATALVYGIATTAGTVYKAFQVAAAASTGGLTVAQWALNAAMTANPIGIIIVAIGALVAGIIWVATQTTFFQDAWAVMTEVIGTAWEWLWGNVLEPVFTAIGTIFTWLYENVITPIVTGILIYVGLWAAVFTWLWETVLSPAFTAIGAVFVWLYETVIAPVVDLITASIQGWGLIFTWLNDTIIAPVFAAIGVAFNWVWSSVIAPVVNFISGAISSVGNTISAVFGGMANIIGGAFQAVLGVIRGPINAIIGLVNGAINGLNSISVTIPAWVPVVGGQTFGVNIPNIPMLARGTNNAPDMFIAGENGPELITGAQGSTVRPYSATSDLLAKGLGGGGGNITIGSVVIEARTVKEFNDIVELVKALPQVSRAGRGTSVRVGA